MPDTENKPDFKWSQVRLKKVAIDQSANGYYIWINGVCVVTRGPIKVEKDGPIKTVTVPLAVIDLIED